MNIKSIFTRSILSVMVVAAALFVLPVTVNSADPVALVAFPTYSAALTCSPTVVSVNISDAPNLVAYHLEIDFDPTKITILNIENGGFIPTGIPEQTNDLGNTTGTILYGMTRQGVDTPPDTTKPLIKITLQGVTAPASVNFTVRPYVDPADPNPPTTGTGSALVGWPDAMPIPFTIQNGVVATQSCNPYDINLFPSQVVENLPVGTLVGDFATFDPDPEPSYTYSLVETATYPDNAAFSISGEQLLTATTFNYETKASYQIKVRSSPASGGFYEEVITILVEDANDPPVLGLIGAQSVNEQALLPFTATATDQDTLPVPDTLTYSLAAGTSGAVPTGASIDPSTGVFTWTPTEAQGPGSYTFDVCVSDGTVSDCETITVTVNEVNAAPSGADKTVTTLEDTGYPFTAADFGFTDPDDFPANTLLAVKITTLPAAGLLKLDGVSVTPGQMVSAANIGAGKLVFTPAANANGTGYASFTFQVQDNGGGGADLDPVAKTMTINVTPVNDAPQGADKTITGNEDTPYTLLVGDFGFSDPLDVPAANAFAGVRIASLPTAGTLKLSGINVTIGQVIPVASLPNLVFTPALNANGNNYSNFTFQVQDNGSGVAPNANLDQSVNTITFNVTPVNDSPVGIADAYIINAATSLPLSVAAPGVLANDSDVDGNTLTASLNTQAAHGTAAVSLNGSFTFAPTPGYVGTDFFKYNLSDGTVAVVVQVNLLIDRVAPPGIITWLEPVQTEAAIYVGYDELLNLKINLSSLTDVVRIDFRWWNTAIEPKDWVIISVQTPEEGKFDYTATLDMTTLPYLHDIQVFAYAYDEAGNVIKTRFFIDHQSRIFLPLILR